MLKQYDIIADFHTHTVFSKHAYSTIYENIRAAEGRGIRYLAVTDHFYQPEDPIERKNEGVRLAYVSKNVNMYEDNVHIISGGEFNLNQPIESDYSFKKIQKNVPWRLVGLHNFFLDPKEFDISYLPMFWDETLKGVGYPMPTAFAHIEREMFSCRNATEKSMQEILVYLVDLAEKNNIFLEVNESSIITDEKGGVDRMKFWINYAKDKNVMFSLGSDAHYCKGVGNFKNCIELLNSIGIQPSRILNCRENEELIKKYC